MSRRLSRGALSALLLALPFEPRRPTVPVLGLELTLLEMVAGVATAALLHAHRDRLRLLLRRPPLPLAFLWAYVAASGLSAAVAPVNRALAAKFVLRMAAAAAFALAVAAAPRAVVRRSLPALTLSCVVVAVLAIAEGVGVTRLDVILDLFRPGPFTAGTSRRATGGSENPNLAAAILLYGLVPAVGAMTVLGKAARLALPLTALFALGLIFTYSRGGLAALIAALLVLAVASAVPDRPFARSPFLALATVMVVAVAGLATRPALRARLLPEGRSPAYAARYDPGESFLSLAPRERRAVPLTITNTGAAAWGAATVGCTWRKAAGDLATDWDATAACPSTRMAAVASGQSLRVDAAIQAPAAHGRYLLVLDLRADDWVLSSLGVPPAAVPAAVSGDPATAPRFNLSVPPGDWERGRLPLWRVALALWREHPLTGVGPDNFRWIHAAHAGWPRGAANDTRIAAGNMFLEAAATTGTLGLLALAGTLTATAWTARRALAHAPARSAERAASAVVVALITGIAVHGMVDSFLGFTAHYLFFGLVVGMAASLDGRVEDG